MRLLDGLLNFLMPNSCPRCGESLKADQMLCENCCKSYRPPDSDRIYRLETESGKVIFKCRAADQYAGVIRRSIHRMKFKGKKVYANGFGMLIAAAIENVPMEFDAVTYVPMTKKGIKERGYNQAELLADELAKLKHLKLCRLLTKIEDSKPQHQLSAEERKTNLKGKFAASPDCRGMRLLLVDDVLTTGSTLTECAETLYNQGADLVYGICVAEA